MIFKDFKDKKISALGLGCMRLPHAENDYNEIDVPAVKEMVKYAMENGVNYYDTAWCYHNGNSETVMGDILSEYPRESYYLASKFPGFDPANTDKVKEIFEEQLRKCKTEYFDFYLFHNVSEGSIDAYLDSKYGIYDYLTEQKRNGRIKHLGFSCHGQYDVLKRFLEAYGKDIDFCQLQVNYLDWTFQHDIEKFELLKEYNIPVWVMEPLRGGRLASLDKKYEEKLISLRPDETVPAWAFRFLQTLPQVTVTLSGMSNMEQLCANVKTFATDEPLNETEMKTLLSVAKDMLGGNAVPCTACRYCTEHCPQGFNIPFYISVYNEHQFGGGKEIPKYALEGVTEEKWPDKCLHCKACEKVCPQNIKISDFMTDFYNKIEK